MIAATLDCDSRIVNIDASAHGQYLDLDLNQHSIQINMRHKATLFYYRSSSENKTKH